MPDPGGLKAGKISKPYGLQGKVSLILTPSAGKLITTDIPLFILIDGQRVPFFIKEFDLVSPDQAIIKFDFIDSVEEARKVSGCETYLDPKRKSVPLEVEPDMQKVVGYEAIDVRSGILGKVTSFLPHEMNPVWVIEHKGREILIPAVEEFIHQINHNEQTIHLILPEGLISL